MSTLAKYNLGRVIKIGALTKENIREAIINPEQEKTRNSIITFIDMEDSEEHGYIFGYIAKYRPEGEVAIVEQNKGMTTKVDNQLIGACPFLYIPSESTIAYQSIPPLFPPDHFRKIFSKLVLKKFDGIMIDCEVEPIGDMEGFLKKVSSLISVSTIKATVRPPNPLYGPCWKSLKDFLEKRNASSFEVHEKAEDDSLNTQITQLSALEESSISEPDEPYDITDAAVMMAIDGYGEAVVKGKRSYESRIWEFKTKDSQVSFEFDRKPNAYKLYKKVMGIIEALEKKRKWKH